MAEDVEVSNTCCAALKKKHAKLLEKYAKVEELKNKFRDCTALVQNKYDAIEKENERLKTAVEELKVQANVWKDEKEKESGIRVDLEDEVSALKDEVQLLKQNGSSASQEADKQVQERLNVAEKEINELKGLLDKERARAALEKKKAELEKKKADDAAKKVELGKKKVSEAQKVVNVEMKKAEESRLLCEKLKVENDALKSTLALERSKSEAAAKKVEAEKQVAIRERKRADLALAKSEEHLELAETNLKKAMFEKDRADDLSKKFEEARNRAENLEKLREHILSANIDEVQAADLTRDDCLKMLENDDGRLPKWMKTMLLEKEHDIIREKKRADSEKKNAKKLRKEAESHKKLAMEQKLRADKLSGELESYKLRLEELQKEQKNFLTCRINAPLINNDVISGSDTVKLLKKQLKLEKMLAKHAQKASKVEAVRNKMLHQEIFHLKQECLSFQQRLDLLDKSFLPDHEGIDKLKEDQTSTRETLCSDGYDRQLISGTDSRLGPPNRGPTQKMLQSSAINSSSASFSDRPLVGSQERSTFSFTTSVNLGDDVSNLKPAIKLCDKMKIRYNEQAVARVGHCERNKILGAFESIQNLYCKGEKVHQQVSKKLSLLHDLLNGQNGEHEKELHKENSCEKFARPVKRRKTSCEGTAVNHTLQVSGNLNSILDLDFDQSDASMRSSPPDFNEKKTDCHFKDGLDDVYGINHCIPQDFDEKATSDYMKLLDLDNAADENSYRRAIAMPLSPSLPEVEFDRDQNLEVDNSEIVVYKSSQEGSSNAKEDSALFIKYVDSILETDTRHQQIPASGRTLGMLDLAGSGNKAVSLLFESGTASSHVGLLKYFVVSSDNKDNSSILRILQTTRSMSHCSFLHSAELFLGSIQHPLLKADDFSMKEKVCVLFSLMLHEISEAKMGNLTNILTDDLVQSLDSATLKIQSALSDPVLRRIFVESFDLFELFAVIEDFLLHGKVWFCGDLSVEPDALHSSKVTLVLNGSALMLSEVFAPAHFLIAGGSFLASLCSAVDHIGFVCEVSCNVILMQKLDPAVMLAVLHAFAHVCGSKYFTIPQYSIAMTLVKSLVTFLEKQTLSTNSTSSSPLIVEKQSKFWLCSNKCPFLEDAVSLEDVALLLLENLQKHGRSKHWSQDPLELVNLVVSRARSHGEKTEEFPGSSVPFGSMLDKNLYDLVDILSLIEVLASYMSWDWTVNHIIGQICEYLESHAMKGLSAAIIVLLGQLGRLGVGASGYEDSAIEKIRGRLSAFVGEITFMKLDLFVQFAIVSSLFGLTSIKFEEIVEGKVDILSITSYSIPVNNLREWFFRLSNEQQSLFRLVQAAGERNYEIGFSSRGT